MFLTYIRALVLAISVTSAGAAFAKTLTIVNQTGETISLAASTWQSTCDNLIDYTCVASSYKWVAEGWYSVNAFQMHKFTFDSQVILTAAQNGRIYMGEHQLDGIQSINIWVHPTNVFKTQLAPQSDGTYKYAISETNHLMIPRHTTRDAMRQDYVAHGYVQVPGWVFDAERTVTLMP